MRRVAILQSNYIPWKGHFDVVAAEDGFIVCDCVQYTKKDWRNRNQIKAPRDETWLTVPVRQRNLDQTIEETEITDPHCFLKHWQAFRQSYAMTMHIGYCCGASEPLFADLAGADAADVMANQYFSDARMMVASDRRETRTSDIEARYWRPNSKRSEFLRHSRAARGAD